MRTVVIVERTVDWHVIRWRVWRFRGHYSCMILSVWQRRRMSMVWRVRNACKSCITHMSQATTNVVPFGYAPGWRVAKTSRFPTTSPGAESSKMWMRNLSVCWTAEGETATCRTTISVHFWAAIRPSGSTTAYFFGLLHKTGKWYQSIDVTCCSCICWQPKISRIRWPCSQVHINRANIMGIIWWRSQSSVALY